MNGAKLANYAILKLIIVFNLQTELTLPQEASVDIYKASQKAYNNEFQHKEYHILADLWKNCMNSYQTVIKFEAISTLARYSIDVKEKHDAFDSRMEEKQPSNTQESSKNSPSSVRCQYETFIKKSSTFTVLKICMR
ncbi:hypothetical protein O181_069849 [Austropuccinia psidii MF-1]|uniref:Uncharacterized protein n=1 Tax=Austropuccinia psidii MF-1 TaxID=1389203 RepID=A0A9Q3F035_9BASI|nr:hypothetical protein [Austropuccinia psidii MF-1]